MLNAIIVDDEQDGREVLQLMLTDFCSDVIVVETCASGREGIKAINIHKPDLVFMDIDMPDVSGFEVLDCVKKLDLKVIFVTAHNEHAIRAFRYSAVDYILKPPAPQALIEAVEKARNIQFKTSGSQYDLLLGQLKSDEVHPKVIALPMADGLEVVNVEEIMYCKADRNYTHIHFTDKKKLLVSRQLKEFENMLSPQGFFRVHNSSLINLRFISKYVRGDAGYIIMKDGASVELSRQKKEEFLRLINKV